MTASAAASHARWVAALVEARSRAATERFDAVLAAAVERGSVDPEVAKALRWWQRESVREVVDHVAAVVPATVDALTAAAADAVDAVAAAEHAWRAAGGRDLLADRPQAAGPPPADTGEPVLSADRTDAGTGAPAEEPTDETAAAARQRLVVAGLTRPAEGAR